MWNDHYRPYDPRVIKMGFGQVQLVVTPLPNTLYLIEIHRDPTVRRAERGRSGARALTLTPARAPCGARPGRTAQVAFFGPLVDHMIVARPVLPALVRTTAMNAFRRVRVAEASSSTTAAP